MEYGICNLATVPLRVHPSHGSEQVTQLLFGETFEVLEHEDNWAKIICTLDGYKGWIHHLQFATLPEDTFELTDSAPKVLTTAFITAALKQADNSILYLPINCELPFYDSVKCTIGDDIYVVDNKGLVEGFLEITYSFINAPYLWGGRTHFGVDCSGFSQAVLRTQGIVLKRDAWQQAEQGTAVDFLPEARLGDLAFFDNDEGRITHVGIMLNNEMIIHASGKVKIEQIDGQGIYSAELKKYTHKLRIIKRFF